MPQLERTAYCQAILEAHEYLLEHHKDVFVIGQGLWSPWYVGNSMKDLDIRFGRDRVMDSPVSEEGVTGIAVGASLAGYRPIVVHPRVDFMILATNQIVNQAAKWSHMLGGQAHPAVTIRGIVNRGGEQGAQHSQALHSWFAHVPGLRVVMPARAKDARDLLIAAVLCDDPVLYIDDRWCYEHAEVLPPISPQKLAHLGPEVVVEGTDVTLVGSSHSTLLCMTAAEQLKAKGISAEVIDLRIVNPLKHDLIVASVKKTGRLLAVDGSWATCGLAGEIIAGSTERVPLSTWKSKPARITLPAAPAPTSKVLESVYYPKADDLVRSVEGMLNETTTRHSGLEHGARRNQPAAARGDVADLSPG